MEEAEFKPPNKEGVLDAGGGPAGVVEVFPKRPPAGPGVVEAPNVLPPPLPAPVPNNPPELGVAASVFAGVEVPVPKSEPPD